MAKRTTRSRTRKKTGAGAPNAPKIDASRLFPRQYPLTQLGERWVEELADRLKTATEAEATAVSAELALERQALAVFERMDALSENIQETRTTSPANRAGEERDSLKALREENKRIVEELELLSGKGSTLACHALGSVLLNAQEVTRKKLQKARNFFTRAAERGFAPAFWSLSECCRLLEDKKAAEDWFAKALDAKEPPALVAAEWQKLLAIQPLPPEELQASLERLYNLALAHCWEALSLLTSVCKLRRENEIVSAFAPRPLQLLQELARQGFAPAMCVIGNYYDTILLAPDISCRDKRVQYWFDKAAEQNSLTGLVSSLRAGFFGPAYRGPVHTAIARITAMAPDTPREAAELKGLLGRMLRQPGMPADSRDRSDALLLEAAEQGNTLDLGTAIRFELIWDEASASSGYPAGTLLDDKRLNKDPHVLFTRGQTMLNCIGEHDEAFGQRAVKYIKTAAKQGDAKAVCWLADAALRGLYGIVQNIGKGLEELQAGLSCRHLRAMALEAIRQLGWIRGIPGNDHVDRDWVRELLGMSASEDDALGFAALVLLEALEPAPLKRQKELGVLLDRAIMWARVQADASALYLIGCVATLNMENPDLNAVCKFYDAHVSRKTGNPLHTGDFAAYVARDTFHSAGLVGEPKGMLLCTLVDPDLGNLQKIREQGTSLEQFM